MAAKKNWIVDAERSMCKTVTEQAQSRELPRRPVRSAAVKVRWSIHPSPSSERYRMSRPVRTAVVPVRSSRKSVRPVPEQDIHPARRRLKSSIPAGIDNGQSVRIRGKGEPGVNGGPRGDLLVEVNVSRHPIFQRQDMHIFSTVPISFAQAALGGDVQIPDRGRRRYLHRKTGHKDRYKSTSERKRSSVP